MKIIARQNSRLIVDTWTEMIGRVPGNSGADGRGQGARVPTLPGVTGEGLTESRPHLRR